MSPFPAIPLLPGQPSIVIPHPAVPSATSACSIRGNAPIGAQRTDVPVPKPYAEAKYSRKRSAARHTSPTDLGSDICSLAWSRAGRRDSTDLPNGRIHS